jgi:Protein of unknown function (DUF3800)
MVPYSAYFDESTNEKSPILVIAGFLSTDVQWDTFKTEWTAVLKEYGLKAFHMQHFAQRSGEFVRWPEDRRRELLSKLLAIIQSRVELGVAAVVHVREFQKVFGASDAPDIGSAYTLCCTACHLEAGEWAKSKSHIEPISYHFDAGHQDASEAKKTFLDIKDVPENVVYRMGSINFEHDSASIPIQAADIAAYELWRWLDEHFADRTRHGRFPLAEIIKTPWKIREFDREILEQIVQHRKGLPVSKRIINTYIPALRPGRVATPEEFKRMRGGS